MDSGLSERNCIRAPTENKTARTEHLPVLVNASHKHSIQLLTLPTSLTSAPVILQPQSKGKSEQAGGGNQLRVNGER